MFILQDVFPMIRELQFDAKFRRAMLTVFGKTLMCRDIDVASQYSKSANMDCVTMEGMLYKDTCSTFSIKATIVDLKV
jgi:chromosome segregation ATPase